MAIIQVGDFGEINGVRTYRINGDKPDLEKIIDECRKLDAKFEDVPEIHKTHRCYSLLLKIRVPVQVGEDRHD
jgi:hypothetical protein